MLEQIPTLYAEAGPPTGRDLIRHRTAKSLGELAELAFSYKAASLGFGLAKPLGDNQPFDFILNSGHRLWRVQVKSTYRQAKSGAYILNAARSSPRGKTRTYTADLIDVLAGWVMPLDVWYIVPVRAFAPRCGLALYPHRDVNAGQFEPFREAWCLLACWKEGASGESLLIERCCQMNENLMRASHPDSPCPLREVLSRLQSQSPENKRRPSP
jgi:PD-(D/E)XK endonuclease